jgi:hypothetical protein
LGGRFQHDLGKLQSGLQNGPGEFLRRGVARMRGSAEQQQAGKKKSKPVPAHGCSVYFGRTVAQNGGEINAPDSGRFAMTMPDTRQSRRGFDMDYCVQLSYQNIKRLNV